MQRAAQGERRAFALLVERHQAAVLRFARAVTACREDAEDVLQETFLSVWRSAGSYRGEASVRHWLFTIARNAAFQQRRRQQPAAVVTAIPEEQETPLAELAVEAGWGETDPETMAMRAQDQKRLGAALARLPAEYREVLVLRDLEEIPGERVAEMLGLTMAAMKSRLHRARLYLAARVHRREAGHAGI